MEDRKKVIIDAGHGGIDSGAVYYGRQEKDDALNLAKAIGNVLEDEGVKVVYTRMDDTYNTPLEKAVMGNRSDADYFVSLHRNAALVPNTGSGVETLVFENSGEPAVLAENINAALSEIGFTNRGVVERPGLAVLRRTEMPSVLVEVGFIDNEADNQLFDRNFKAIAQGIASGILAAIEREELTETEYYQVQTGAYQTRGLAEQLLIQLQSQGYPAFIIYDDGFYKVRVGNYEKREQAEHMEKTLRQAGYPAVIVERDD